MQIYQIIRSKRRTIALIVDREGRLIVRAPLRATQKQILEVVGQKEKWILAKQKLANAMHSHSETKAFINGEEFLYLGDPYKLEIIQKSSRILHLSDKFYLLKSMVPQAEEAFKEWYRAQARKVITERVHGYAAQYRFEYRRVRITSAKTRWGSCSPKGNLNFSWRLVMAPLQVIDYVVVHELVHLIEKNHSRRFWDRVKTILPDYTQQVRWLKTFGFSLKIT